ncbi:leucine-rich repeat protein [Cellulomonas sp. PhB150]|uniref:leucine-rich repeat protein n=1 Tax=Cellulomonas sp. PhB150 TaxID=2485188 RepID=UPI000F480277|nr:leucine-rich repeat protein [Cellulomonas sp. PhB150]ROS23651.1 leucine rich repeat (LRR) protein [Cellulomonas sp. PhB150]
MSTPRRPVARRLLPGLVAAALVLVGVTAPAQTAAGASSGVAVGAFTYVLDPQQHTATLKGWSGKRRTTITVPGKITTRGATYRVTTIGRAAFAGPVDYVLPGRSPVPATKVSIPSGVVSIEDYAFYGNRITSFVIPASVTWIGTNALNQDEIAGEAWKYSLRKVTFRGAAPQMGELGDYVCSPGGCGYNGIAPFGIGNGLIVYYPKGAKGFTSPTWAGYMAAPAGSKSVPTGYGSHVGDLDVSLDREPVAGVKVTASLRAWAVGGKLSPKPTTLTYLWQLRGTDGTWKKLRTGKSVTLPKDSAGKVLRVLTIANGPGKRSAVLQLRGVRTVLHAFAKKPRPTITLPSGVKKAAVGTKLTAAGATAGKWSPHADSVRYRWYRNGKAITKATKRTYTVTAADRGKKLTVRATATKAEYGTASRTSAALAVPKKR